MEQLKHSLPLFHISNKFN
jgi:hypothetical protein